MGKNKHVDLFNDIIPAVDLGIKELWDAATDEGKKKLKATSSILLDLSAVLRAITESYKNILY